MKKTLFYRSILVFTFLTASFTNIFCAQTLNARYMELIYNECEKPDIIDVQYSEDNYLEIDFLCNGKRYEMGIKDKTFMFLETGVPLSEIPLEKIKDKLAKNYSAWVIDEASLIKTIDNSFYKVEMIKDGIEQNLYFTKEGNWFKFNTLELSDKWDLTPFTQNKNYVNSGYNFFEPNISYEMPELLREISGITLKNSTTMYCVQDELAAIFEYNFEKEEITEMHRFSDIGDFEDLAILKGKIYVLRSDGLLFPYNLITNQLQNTASIPINSLDIEGLFSWKNELYIACKAPGVNQETSKRSIFKVKEKKFNKPELFMEIDINEIIAFVEKNYEGINITELQFNPSALAFHPKTEELYVLSASDRVLSIYKDKQLTNVLLLPTSAYYKPEGLAFTKNGDLYISNEGDKKGFIKGNILFFEYFGSK